MKIITASFISITLLINPLKATTHSKKTIKSAIKRNDDSQTLNSLMDILKYHIKYPDNVSQQNLIISGTTMLIGLVTYYGADTILQIPVLGNVLQKITNTLVTPKDLIEGLSLAVGIFGSLGLYKNKDDLRKKFLGSCSSIVFAKQVSNPGKVEDGEVWTSVLQSFALLHLLTNAEDLVTPIVEKGIHRALKRIEAEEEFEIDPSYRY